MRLGTTGVALALALLAACGGGGGDGVSEESLGPQVTISGTVATNVLSAGQPMRMVAPAGAPNPTAARSAGATSGPDGRYSVTAFLGSIRPILVTAAPQDEPQYPRLTGVAYRSGTAQVTPLTSLLVARLLNRRPDPGGDIPAVLDLQNRPEADLSTARAQVVAYLLARPSKDNGNATSRVDVSLVTDFVSMPLNAVSGDPYFEALGRLHDSLMDSETIQGVEEHMLFRSDAPADLRSMLAFDFLAECTVQFLNGAVPSGTARIVLDRRAIAVGSVDFAFQTGDSLGIEAPQAFQATWSFGFTSSQSRVEIKISSGRLSAVLISAPAGSSRCLPQSDVLVAGKLPSQIALIRLFGQSLASPFFNCAAATYPGFLAAPNLLAIELNGALRINGVSGPGAPALHLPSLNLTIGALITVAAGQVQPIRPTFFRAERPFTGGFDLVLLRADPSGQITGLSLQRQSPQFDNRQTCGTL
jgi:hypothetical protein